VGVDVENRKLLLRDDAIEYDSLIIATGARHHYFGNDAWEPLAPGLKTVEDATEIRRRLLMAFETAEREDGPAAADHWLTFVIVGAGPTGLELAGAVAELSRHTLKRNFRNIDPARARIIVMEHAPRVLPPYPEELSERATSALARLGVEVRTGQAVTEIHPDHVVVKNGDQLETIPTHTVLWAAGVRASPLGKALADATGAKLDRAGRVIVGPDCTVAGHPEIFVIGDLANYPLEGGAMLPGVAPVAVQQGKYAARTIRLRLEGREPAPFHYHDLGNMATIGRGKAVAHIGKFKFSGFIAWLLWLFVHLMNIVGFENRLLVLTQWGWNFMTRNRAARLITGEHLLPKLDEDVAEPETQKVGAAQ
jgi:NADH dehydrogenase